ncbi:protein ecdysoneless homolog isoform X2 [Narcine bancroftii]|uniref:protein ecdysoneless homolog isoform X2 n=1 Tax=Narcine bancroftii TaxID=1343680 RepID=UPI003831F165
MSTSLGAKSLRPLPPCTWHLSAVVVGEEIHQAEMKLLPTDGDIPAHIGGMTNFGDNVDDEWLIVYLIQQITKEFQDMVASIEDDDGDFLLIEAAKYLPKWLNPDTSVNRVYFYHGELHIIPLPQSPGDLSWLPASNLTISQVLSLLPIHSEKCLAAEPIRNAINRRIQSYPEKILNDQHRAYCYVPAGIAAVLKRRPDLLAPAIQAFYLRDPIDLRACRSFKFFRPETSVMALVTFTKCLYAQLQQQQFVPDRRSGFVLPAQSDQNFKAHSLGAKLAHGFEIMCSKCSQPLSSCDAGNTVTNDPLWEGFLNSLKKNAYFKGELEGSARYRELLQMAEIYFQQSVTRPKSSYTLCPGEQVMQLLQTQSYSVEELQKEAENLPPEDDDSWLNISLEELDQMLEEASGTKLLKSTPKEDEEEEEEEEEEDYDLQDMTKCMKAFISKVSSHEGAEVPRSSASSQVQFDVDSFTNALEKILGVKSDQLDSDDIEEEDDDLLDSGEEFLSKEENSEERVSAAKTLENIRDYMDQMDRELASTYIGKSFTKVTGQVDLNNPNLTKAAEAESEDYLNTLPVDVDLNLVENLLESYSSQAGLPGPVSNILQSMGLRLPDNKDNAT